MKQVNVRLEDIITRKIVSTMMIGSLGHLGAGSSLFVFELFHGVLLIIIFIK